MCLENFKVSFKIHDNKYNIHDSNKCFTYNRSIERFYCGSPTKSKLVLVLKFYVLDYI